jgi:hypothetical protein
MIGKTANAATKNTIPGYTHSSNGTSEILRIKIFRNDRLIIININSGKAKIRIKPGNILFFQSHILLINSA